MISDEDEQGVFSRLQTRSGCAAGKQRLTVDASSDRGGYLAIDAAELANGGSRRDRAIAGGGITGSDANAIACGPGVADHAVEA